MSPSDLRIIAAQARQSFASKEEAQKEAQIRNSVDKAVAEFAANAQKAAEQGYHSVEVWECQGDYESLKDVGEHSTEVIARLKKHFEALGYATRIHGPYSEAYVGGGCWDLMVEW